MASDKQDPNNKSYLNKLSAAECAELLGTVASVPSLAIEVASVGGETFESKVRSMKGSVAELSLESSPKSAQPGSVGASFVLNLSKYLVKSTLQQAADGRWFIDFRGDIFLVQRRKNFRVDVPAGIVPKVEIAMINRPEREVKARLLNISLGGCFLEVDAPVQMFRAEAQVKLTMTIEGGKVIPLNCIVRRVSPLTAKQEKLQLGVEFDRLNSFEESRVNEIVMKCYRLTNRLGLL